MPALAWRPRRTITAHALACLWLLTLWWAVAHAADDVAWSFAGDVRAGDTVELTVTGLPDVPGLWIALAAVDAPIGAYHDWDYPPTRHDRVLFRLPDAPSTLEFRLYRDVGGSTDLLARSAPFLPAPQPASLHAPAEVAIGSRFAVAWTGPDRAGDTVVLLGPTGVVPAVPAVPALASAPTAAGQPLHLDAPWAPGRYHLRYVTGADQVVLAQIDIDVVDRSSADRTDACDAPPSEASLLAAFDAEVAAALPLARRAYGLDHADYTATATVTGSDGSVHASYTIEVVDPVTGERQRLTGSASDPLAWQQHIGNKARRDLISRRAKDPDDPLQLVIVRDMWLTGFDAPAMHTMYVDKPMRGHGLMQAIARVNRVFRDKPGGLVVDYIGVAQNLKEALGQYSSRDQKNAGIDKAEAIAVMQEKHDIVRAMLYGLDYRKAVTGSDHERFMLLAEAIDFIQRKQHEDAARETGDEAKKRAHRRYQDAVLALSKAYALVASSDEARAIREEVGFFQAIRAALVKSDPRTVSHAAQETAIRQLIDRAVASTEIVDILAAAGLETPNVGILSDQFLADLQAMERKNLALEALKKLLGDEIRSRSRTNVVESRLFSERLEDAIARYHTNAISTVEILQELVTMAKDLKASIERGEDEGLTPDEVAFYDALSQNESAVQILGNDELKVIAQLLLTELKKNVTVDWAHRESARARLRILVKDILEEHGYPPTSPRRP